MEYSKKASNCKLLLLDGYYTRACLKIISCRRRNLAVVFVYCGGDGAYTVKRCRWSLTHEDYNRGAGGGSWELYYRNKSDGATDSEEIWNIEIYGT